MNKWKRLILTGALCTSFFVSASTCAAEQMKLESLQPELVGLEAQLYTENGVVVSQQGLVSQVFNSSPESSADWVSALEPYIPAVGEITLIPGTDFKKVALRNDGTNVANYLRISGKDNQLNIWVGMGFDYANGVARVLAPGGHADGGANSVYRFDVASLAWHRDYDYAQPVAPYPNLVDSNGDGIAECVGLVDGPMASHSYDGVVYIPSIKATLIMGTAGFYPRWKDTSGTYCDRHAVQHKQWLWTDDGKWVDLGIPSEHYVRSVYDVERDRVLAISKTNPVLTEINPHTWKRREVSTQVAGNTGATMTMLDRYVYWTTVNSGTYRIESRLDGSFGPVEKLLDYRDWKNKGWGLAGSGDLIVGWDGDKQFYHFDTKKNEGIFVTAAGNMAAPASTERVYGKFIAIPEKPGLFMGVIREGIVLYRGF